MYRVRKVSTVPSQERVDSALRVVGSASEYRAVSLPDSIGNVLFHCVSCAYFVTEHSFLKAGLQQEIRRLSRVIVVATGSWK